MRGSCKKCRTNMGDRDGGAIGKSHSFVTRIWLVKRKVAEIGSQMMCGSSVHNPIVRIIVGGNNNVSSRLPQSRRGGKPALIDGVEKL
ncbi:unnamed protein product [Microthlaspi erraticum]|uniref:Uncharacterized protein n=1 Tax=Microthlaspi erraticum TaxID=1685480 RepID=A0A6D2HVH9_9BRAS|nr:unnamed protein product [Microthlaspi erraticum]